MFYIFNRLIILVLIVIYNFHLLAEESFSEEEKKSKSDISIIDSLLHITCETEGVGNLLREKFSHTCIAIPIADFQNFSLILPTAAPAILRVKINDKDLFPDACSEENKADPRDPKISFAYCSNILLTANLITNFADTLAQIIAGMMKGGNFDWETIAKGWHSHFSKEKYHYIYKDKKAGDHGVIGDIGSPALFLWKVDTMVDQICLYASIGILDAPIGCKFMKEPFPKSIYTDFIESPKDNIKDIPPKLKSDQNNNRNYLGDASKIADPTKLTKCMSGGIESESCYRVATNNSKTVITMTGPIVECVKVMIAKIMINKDVCSFNDIYGKMSANSRSSSVLFQFQLGMQKIVKIALTIYVALYGMNIALAAKPVSKKEIFEFIFKLIFVTYFSIGLPVSTSSGGETRLDGIVEYILPFLFSITSELASWVVDLSPSNLCKFNINEYDKAYKGLFIWDVIDCKMSHYLGLNIFDALRKLDLAGSFQGLSGNAIPPYLVLLIPAIIFGWFSLVFLILTYPLLLISVVATIVNLTICCIIMISILALLAPIFVPLYLFNYTKGYALKWANLLFSLSLQPMVAVLFATLLFSVYDKAFYGTCKYVKQSKITDGRKTEIFLVDNDWSKYVDEDEVSKCKYSLGSLINNTKNVVEFVGGLFSNFPKFKHEVGELLLSMFTGFLMLYLMMHLSKQLVEFVVDITLGIQTDNLAVPTKKLEDRKSNKKKESAKDKITGGDEKGSKDKVSTGGRSGVGGGIGDKISTGGRSGSGEGVSDKVSVGDRSGSGEGVTDKVSVGGGEKTNADSNNSRQKDKVLLDNGDSGSNISSEKGDGS